MMVVVSGAVTVNMNMDACARRTTTTTTRGSGRQGRKTRECSGRAAGAAAAVTAPPRLMQATGQQPQGLAAAGAASLAAPPLQAQGAGGQMGGWTGARLRLWLSLRATSSATGMTGVVQAAGSTETGTDTLAAGGVIRMRRTRGTGVNQAGGAAAAVTMAGRPVRRSSSWRGKALGDVVVVVVMVVMTAGSHSIRTMVVVVVVAADGVMMMVMVMVMSMCMRAADGCTGLTAGMWWWAAAGRMAAAGDAGEVRWRTGGVAGRTAGTGLARQTQGVVVVVGMTGSSAGEWGARPGVIRDGLAERTAASHHAAAAAARPRLLPHLAAAVAAEVASAQQQRRCL